MIGKGVKGIEEETHDTFSCLPFHKLYFIWIPHIAATENG